MNTKLPPGPDGGLLGLGLLKRMQTDLAAYCADLARSHGDCVHYSVGPIRVFQFTHPEQVHEVLVAKHRSMRRAPRMKQVLGQWNGNGLVVSEGDLWVRQRRLVQTAFKPQRIAAHVSEVARRASRMADSWQGRGVIDASAELSRLTLGIVAEALFGADVESSTDDVMAAVAVLNEIAIYELAAPFVLPLWAPTPSKRRLRAAIAVLDGLARRFIRERRQSKDDRGDLLSTLLTAVDEEGDGRGMSDEQVRDEAVNLLLAGNETTATGLIWTAHLLAAHPDTQEEVRREIAEVLAGAPPTFDALPALKRTTNAFKEAMRLYPPAYILTREASEDVEIGGWRVPRGAQVHLSPYVTHRDPRWFADPDAFRPDRFESEASFPRGSYLPFGLGPRACIGRSFAMMEAPIAIAAILQRFRLRPAPGYALELEAQVSLHPKGGLPIAIEPVA